MAILEAERKELNRLELERIRRQREEREMISAKKLEEKERILMERERENLGDWEEKERIFHLSQAYQKVYIRVREGRARNLHLISLVTLRLPLLIGKEAFKDEEIILLSDSEVSSILNRIEYEQINDALDELNDLFIPFEKDRTVLNFWEAFKEVASQRKQNLKENRNIAIVKDEVNAIFNDKSSQKLKELREGIEKKLKNPNVDTDYWTDLLTELDQVILKRKLDELYLEMKEKLIKESKSKGFSVLEFKFSDLKSGDVKFKDTKLINNSSVDREDQDILEKTAVDINCKDTEDVSRVNWDNCPAALNLLEMEQTRNVGKDELPFNTEAEDLLKSVESKPLWSSKYPNIKPRKPRFFNRVRMNYVWNKYNQTHYDTSNPPPKVVQGFRFNIFYPDLLQQSSSSNSSFTCPTYSREADPTNENNEIVRFSAGPPYSDVIFRIPREEWDMSSQHGFKCIFERGALRLHFWFRSQRYRR